MIKRLKFEDDCELNFLIEENSDLRNISIEYLTDGNYVTFTDESAILERSPFYEGYVIPYNNIF